MRRVLPFFTLLLFLAVGAKAQNYKVLSMEHLPNDMTARDEMKTDDNEKKCAVIKIVTQNITPEARSGFYFQSDWGSQVVHRDVKGGVIRVWVSPGLKTLIIMHEDLGTWELKIPDYGLTVEPLHTYKVVVQGMKVDDGNTKPNFTQQFLQFIVEPKDALVTVENTPWQVIDGVASNRVDFGSYKYHVEANDYHAEDGTVVVNDPEKKVVQEITLKPAFGFLKIDGDQAVLSKSSVFIGNINGADALKSPKKLASGQYKVTVVNAKFKTFERMVTIKDGETTNLKVDLNANYSTVTLQVDADAEIYVNNEYKGIRSWTGDLVAGNYVMECRMKSHRPTSIQKTVTDGMSGQTIKLKAPTPINGALIVNSNPPMAKIFIDGKSMDETPMQFSNILIGEHTLRLEKSGCATLTKTITVEEGKTLTVDEKLDTGRNVLVKTDRNGDKVYVDGNYFGETPYNVPMGFGQHTIRVMRNGVKVEREVNVTESSRNGQEMLFEFGRLIAISTDQTGDVVMVDGVKVGVSPLSVDLPYGSHTIHAERGKKYADKDIQVLKTGGETSHRLVLHGESVSNFVKRGVNFATLDFAYSPAPQTSFGATYGSVKKIGWFVTAASNFSFGALGYNSTCDEQGYVGDDYPEYTGESCATRFSAMAGLVLKIAGPVYLRTGAGYGMRVKSWYSNDLGLVKIERDSYTGVDVTAGLQLNLKGFTMSFDAVSNNFKTLEYKLGLGYCWKKK